MMNVSRNGMRDDPLDRRRITTIAIPPASGRGGGKDAWVAYALALHDGIAAAWCIIDEQSEAVRGVNAEGKAAAGSDRPPETEGRAGLQRGTPARILGMAQALHDARHEVHVAAYPLGLLERHLPFHVHRSPGLPFYNRTAPGPDPVRLSLLLPMLADTTARVVRRHGIDVVHAHHYEGLLAAWPAGRLSRVPVIYDAHTTLAGELPHYRHGLPRRGIVAGGRQLDRHLPRLADYIVATSQHIATELIADGIRADRVTVIGDGIEDAFVAEAIEPLDAETFGDSVVYAGNLVILSSAKDAIPSGCRPPIIALTNGLSQRGAGSGSRLSAVITSSLPPRFRTSGAGADAGVRLRR